MKKLLLPILLLSVYQSSLSQTILKHSTTEQIMAGNSVACSASEVVQDNYLMRRFDLDDFGIVDTAFIINMRFGVENSQVPPYKVRARVYELTDPVFELGNMSYIIGDTLDCYVDSTLYYLETDFPQGSYALPGDTLIGEIYTPTDGAAGFWLGSNNYYESDTSFMMAPGCAFFDPTPVDDIGFPDSHWLIFVEVNQRPKMETVTDWTYKDDSLYLDKVEFHSVNLDEDFDTLTMVRVESLPSNGELWYEGLPVVAGDTIMNPEIDSLLYIPDAGYVGLDTFWIKGKDKYHWTLDSSAVEIEMVNWVASIDEDEKDWEVYPNPVTEELMIRGFDQLRKIQIYDLQGRKVYFKAMKNEKILDVSFLESGTYILDAMGDGGRYTKQFVKQ